MKHDWMFIIVSFVVVVGIAVWFTHPIEVLTDLFDLITLENAIVLIVLFELWVVIFMASKASYFESKENKKREIE